MGLKEAFVPSVVAKSITCQVLELPAITVGTIPLITVSVDTVLSAFYVRALSCRLLIQLHEYYVVIK